MNPCEIVPQYNRIDTSRLIAVNRDGRRVLTAGFPGHAACLWDGHTGQLLRVLHGHDGFITGIALSDDGSRAVTCAMDGNVLLWETDLGQAMILVELPGQQVHGLATTPDFKTLAIIALETLAVYDLASGHLKYDLSDRIEQPDFDQELEDGDFPQLPENIEMVALTPDGRTLITGGSEGTLQIIDLVRDKARNLPAAEGNLTGLMVDPTGKRLLVMTSRGISTWDLATRDRVEMLDNLKERHCYLGLSRDGRRALLGGYDGTLILGDPITGDEIQSHNTGIFPITSLGLSGDGQRGFSTANDAPPQVWDLTAGRHVANLGSPRPLFKAATWSRDGQGLLGMPSLTDVAFRWRFGAEPEFVPVVGERMVRFLTSDGAFAISPGSGNSVAITALADGQTRTLEGHADSVRDFSCDRKQRWLLTSDGRVALLWELSTGKKLRTFKAGDDDVSNVALSHDGRFMVSNHLRKVTLWDVVNGKRARDLEEAEHYLGCLAISPDGSRIVGGGEADFSLWDAGTGRKLAQVQGHKGQIQQLSFSADGSLLASASDDGTARLWDAKSGKPIRTFHGHTGPVQSFEFSPDGRQGLTTSQDGSVRFWNVLAERELAALIAYPQRSEWILWTPDGRFDGSPRADRFVSFRVPGTLEMLPSAVRQQKRVPGMLGKILGP